MAPSLVLRSGGQSGADRGALLAALDCRLEYRGWVPKGGRCEDSPYLLQVFPLLRETKSDMYRERTELNVRDSDATLIVTPDGDVASSGSLLTLNCCKRLGKPCRVCPPDRIVSHVDRLVRALQDRDEIVLNVAGTRGSRAPLLQNQVRLALIDAVSVLRRAGLISADPFVG